MSSSAPPASDRPSDGQLPGDRPAAARLVGIDLARLLAVAGMMAAHTLGTPEEPTPAAIVALTDGPPSTLFTVLGGVSVVLAARARLAVGDRSGAVRSTLARGMVVALLGLLVIPLASTVYVVLVPFGIAIMAAAVLLLLPSWLLAVLAAALAAVGGSVVVAAHERLPLLERSHSLQTLWSDPLATAADVLLTGVYPVLTWLAYLLLGMLVARGLLAARATGRERAMLLGVGAAGALLTAAGVVASEIGLRLVAAAEYSGELELTREVALESGYGVAQGSGLAWQLLAAPHSGTPADIARTAGIALLVIAMLSLLATRLPTRGLRVLEPLRAAGGAPLTIYIVHVILLSFMGALLRESAPALVDGWTGWALQVAVALAIGAMLAVAGSKGPFERFVGAAADRAGGPRPSTPAQQ